MPAIETAAGALFAASIAAVVSAAVIGGLIAFGLVGIFIGPVVLAITYTLLGAWMAEAPPAADGPGDPH